MTSSIALPGVPFPLMPSSDTPWEVAPDGRVGIAAPARTDIFVDPKSADLGGGVPAVNAPMLLGPVPDGDFRFSARVTVDFGATFDAGVLLLWFDDRHWGKLCFEYSPEKEPMIVTVVNREVSDDANAFTVDGRSVWLRVSRVDGVYGYHASTDGTTWRLVRAFALDAPGSVARIGLEAQSPVGEGCAVTFDEVRYDTVRVEDFRDGS